MSLTTLLGVAGTIFGLLGLIGGAVAYLLSIRHRTTITVLKQNNEALVERVDLLEVTERDCKVRLAAAEVKVQVLTDTVTQAHAVADLQTKVDRIITVATALELKVDQALERLEGAT